MVYAQLGKRGRSFRLNYKDVTVDLSCFALAYTVAMACTFVPSRPLRILAAGGLLGLYGYYVKIKFSDDDAGGEPSDLSPLVFAKNSARPSYALIGLQAVAGLGGLALGAHLFVMAADSTAHLLAISPLILALLIAPLATELPEMSNSFLWLYQKKDRLAVGQRHRRNGIPRHRSGVGRVVGTEWTLAPSALLTMVLAVLAAGSLLLQAVWSGQWRPWLLTIGAILYIGYACYLYGY